MTIELEKTKKRLYNSERANFNHKLNLKKGKFGFFSTFDCLFLFLSLLVFLCIALRKQKAPKIIIISN